MSIMDSIEEKYEAKITELKADVERLREELSDKSWRLRAPYDAFLYDSTKKNNCANCKHMKGHCEPPNSDRINCSIAEGWPHWTHRCRKWEAQTALAGKEER